MGWRISGAARWSVVLVRSFGPMGWLDTYEERFEDMRQLGRRDPL